jgi:uncharacterized repeat protein (TIGR01451 family)
MNRTFSAIIISAFLAIGVSGTADFGRSQPVSPNVLGFMSVRRVLGSGPYVPGDTVRWTIDYINTGTTDVPNFQIRDVMQSHFVLRPASNRVNLVSSGGTAVRNLSYDGMGDDSTSDLLAPGGLLPVNGRIQVVIDTQIANDAPLQTFITNQSSATGSTMPSSVLSDAVDGSNVDMAGPGSTPREDSLPQFQDPLVLHATIIRLPVAIGLEWEFGGSVISNTGRGISNVRVTVQDLLTLESKTAITNAFGYYKLTMLAGYTYRLTVHHKRYQFETPSRIFTYGYLGPVPADFIGTLR